MRIDPDACADLLAAEVRRLRAVIAASEPTLTDEEREVLSLISKTIRGRGWADWANVLDELLKRLK